MTSAELACMIAAVFLSCLTTAQPTEMAQYHDYCVVGAGPGGLQVGYFLMKKNRDYIVFEKSNTPGNFFTLFPRHRTLISINKRNTGHKNKEFNMRHDWNSLLSDDESLLFRHYSQKMFPQADILVKYLQDYQSKLGIQVQFNTTISNIHTMPNSSAPDGHIFLMNDQHGNLYSCRTLIVASGLWKQNIPLFPGMEYTQGYDNFSIDPMDYEGKSVLILGRGNSAFEMADSIYGNTNLIHMVSRSRVRLSWATHYVGDLRGVNNAILDTYQLKALDGVLEASMDDIAITKKGDKLFLLINYESMDDNETAGSNMLTDVDNFALREPYDVVLRCLGFTFDDSLFSSDLQLSRPMGRKKKYPKINHNYESSDIRGLYVAGTVSHSLDHRKSSGGFIHGFRYTAEALHNILEQRYEGVRWPSYTASITQLINTILKRVNEASGIYQMFGMLGDIIVFRNDGKDFEYFEEFPVNLLANFENATGAEAGKMLVVLLQYGTNFSGPDKDVFRIDRATGEPADAFKSNFLHPVIYYYESLPTESDMKMRPKDNLLPQPVMLHHVVEDFLTLWNAPISHILPLRRFLEAILVRDMRDFYAENCFKITMTHASLPFSCEEYFLQGQGLSGTKSLLDRAALLGTNTHEMGLGI